MNLSEINSIHSSVLAPDSWALLEVSFPGRKVGITKHPGSSVLLTISLCLSDPLTVLPSEKNFQTFSISFNLKYVHLSLTDFALYFRKTNKQKPEIQTKFYWFHTTKCICSSFSLLLIQWSGNALIQNNLFFILLWTWTYWEVVYGRSNVEVIGNTNKSHIEVRWERTRRGRKWQENYTTHLRNLIIKRDNYLLLSPKPWVVKYLSLFFLSPFPLPFNILKNPNKSQNKQNETKLCHHSNSSNS